MKMRKNIVSVLAMLLVLLLTVGSFGAAFAETAATTKPLSELTQEDIDYLRSLLVTEDGPLMGEELLAHINSFTGEELYWTLAAVSDEQYASLQEILTEEELIALFAPLQEVVYVAPRDYTNVAPLVDFGTASYALRAADTGDGNQSETEGLFLKKTAAFDPATYTGKITMEAYVEGSVSTTTTIKPCDIVLVLDVSGSMNKDFSMLTEVYSVSTNKTYYTADGDKITYWSNQGYMDSSYWDGAGWYVDRGRWSYPRYSKVTPKTSASDVNGIQFYGEAAGSNTRLAALKYAANNFIAQIADNAEEKNVDHRVAIVQFAGGGSSYEPNEVVKGLTSVKTGEDSLTTAVNGLNANGATNAHKGMQLALGVINDTKQNGVLPEDRIRVVVLFTDGEPNEGSGFDPSVANEAIGYAKTLKGYSNTTVYSIGIFSGADPETNDNKNNYMNGVSNNYPNATAHNNLGTGSRTAGYYLSASNSSALNNIFSKIASNIMSGSAAVELDETTVITDTISPTFELPVGTDADDIKVYTADSNEDGTWDTPVPFDATVTVDPETQAVTVTGFDFQANYVGEHAADGAATGWAGKKLIIEIPFEPTDDYFGGNKLATNTAAKIENAESKFSEEFGAPTVDVPLRYEIAAQDQAIYLSNTADLSTIMQYVTNAKSNYVSDGATVDANGKVVQQGLVNYTPNGTNNKDVDIVYYLKDSAENTVATLTIPHGTAASDCSWVWAEDVDNTPVLTADTTYTVSCTVTPVTTGTYPAIKKTASGNVYVYKPQVTANDETVDYGAVVTLKDQVVGEVEWTHPKHATIGNLLDPTKPSTVLTFKVNDAVATTATVTAETPVEITLGLNDPQATFNFMPYTTFVRNATTCDFETCDAKDETSHIGTAEACEFKLHLGTISGVKVKKVVTGNMANRNQEFEFTATYADQTVNFKLAHDGEYELKNLPIGATLTITETQTGYTTTYSTTAQEAGEGVDYTDAAIAADDAGKIITFNNHKEAEIDTGISLDSLPYILLLAVVAAGVLFFVVRRKRSED